MFVVLAMTVFAWAGNATAAVPISGPYQPLDGQQRFRAGDDAAWAQPDFDDSGWQRLAMARPWSDAGVESWQENGWYRFRFRLDPDDFAGEPALIMRLSGMAQLWLNGVEIANPGSLQPPGSGDRKRWRQRGIYGDFRAIDLPPRLLNRNGEENVLAMRVRRLGFFEPGGIASLPFGIVQSADARAALAPYERTYWLIDGLLLGTYLVLAIFGVIALARGFNKGGLGGFAAMMGCFFLAELRGARWFEAAGLGSPWIGEVADRMVIVALVPMMEFFAALLRRRIGWPGRIIQASCALQLVTLVPGLDGVGMTAVVLPVALFSLIASTCWVTVISVISIRHRVQHAWLIAVFYSLLVTLPVVLELVIADWADDFELLTGRPSNTLPTFVFLLILAGLAGLRLYEIERERVEANMRTRAAQRGERQRLARDLHDSIGQWLGSLKLRLQLLRADYPHSEHAEGERFEGLIGDVDELIDDTRRMAYDLSPHSIEERGLAAAIADHMEQVGSDHGIDWDVDIDPAITLSADDADHIYRIVQEAAHNALRHSEARHIGVSLSVGDYGSELRIADDGKGYDPAVSAANDRPHLGIRSMGERAAAMGGRIDIDTAPGGGTCVTVALP